MSLIVASTAVVARAVFCASVVVFAVWLFWHGHYQWQDEKNCKVLRPAIPHGPPAGKVLDAFCVLDWSRARMQANMGFMFLTPAVATLAAIGILGFQQHSPEAAHGPNIFTRWGSIMLPPRHFWLWLCEGLTVKDALLVVAWAAFNAVWYSTILGKFLSRVSPGSKYTRSIAKSLAALMMPNLAVLFFPVSRGSAINQALGLSYPEAIRYHRWLGRWVLLLISLHGLMYWGSWIEEGRWIAGALRQGGETNNLMGGVALIFALILLFSSLEVSRRWSYGLFKALHHIGFWGFMLAGCAHHWTLFWYFLPGLLLYAVDGVFRLHQSVLGRGVDARIGATAFSTTVSDAGCCGMRPTELLHADVDPAGTMCSLLLAAPQFGMAPTGVVWINVPAISLTAWHPFDYSTCFHSGTNKPAMLLSIKAYNRWTLALVKRLGQGAHQLTVRVQGPYADVQTSTSTSDGLVIVAGGNGIAAALSTFQELATAGVSTRGLPALLIWCCRKGDELRFMGPKVMAAAGALGLKLTTHLYVTAGKDILLEEGQVPQRHNNPAAGVTTNDIHPIKDTHSAASVKDPAITVDAVADHSSSNASDDGAPATAAVTSLCPVVAFASFAGQLSFKFVLHIAVFAGAFLGIALARYVSAVLPVQSGTSPWETRDMGIILVVLTAACSLALGLITLWLGLMMQRRHRTAQGGTNAPPHAFGHQAAAASSPASVAAAMMGKHGSLLPTPTAASPDNASSLLLHLPTATGSELTLPVTAGRPPLKQLLQSWLAGLQQLPAGDKSRAASGAGKPLSCIVYGCGPASLVASVQLLADEMNAKQRRGVGAGGGRRAVLDFVCKTHQL